MPCLDDCQFLSFNSSEESPFLYYKRYVQEHHIVIYYRFSEEKKKKKPNFLPDESDRSIIYPEVKLIDNTSTAILAF